MAIAYKNKSRSSPSPGEAIPPTSGQGIRPSVRITHGQNGASGFSLIELLTVIAVVGVVASLLFSALSSAQKRAQSIHCLSNLRELAQAQALYVTDQNAYPPANLFDPDRRMWGDYLNRVLGARSGDLQSKDGFKGVFVCPSHVKRTAQARFLSSYGYNAFGSGGGGLGGHFVASDDVGEPPDHLPTVESDVVIPSEMLAMGDGYVSANASSDQAYPNTGGGLFEAQLFGRATTTTTRTRQDLITAYLRTQEARKRHQDRMNAVYCDGHAEAHSIRFLFFEKSDAALRLWNVDHQPHREFWPQLP